MEGVQQQLRRIRSRSCSLRRRRSIVQSAQQILKVSVLPPCDAAFKVALVPHTDAEHVQLLRRLDRTRTSLSGHTETFGSIPSKFFKVGLSEATSICFAKAMKTKSLE